MGACLLWELNARPRKREHDLVRLVCETGILSPVSEHDIFEAYRMGRLSRELTLRLLFEGKQLVGKNLDTRNVPEPVLKAWREAWDRLRANILTLMGERFHGARTRYWVVLKDPKLCQYLSRMINQRFSELDGHEKKNSRYRDMDFTITARFRISEDERRELVALVQRLFEPIELLNQATMIYGFFRERFEQFQRAPRKMKSPHKFSRAQGRRGLQWTMTFRYSKKAFLEVHAGSVQFFSQMCHGVDRMSLTSSASFIGLWGLVNNGVEGDRRLVRYLKTLPLQEMPERLFWSHIVRRCASNKVAPPIVHRYRVWANGVRKHIALIELNIGGWSKDKKTPVQYSVFSEPFASCSFEVARECAAWDVICDLQGVLEEMRGTYKPEKNWRALLVNFCKVNKWKLTSFPLLRKTGPLFRTRPKRTRLAPYTCSLRARPSDGLPKFAHAFATRRSIAVIRACKRMCEQLGIS